MTTNPTTTNNSAANNTESAETQKLRADFENFHCFDKFLGHNGVHVTKISDGYGECEVELEESSVNMMSMAHGGLLMTLCDCAAGIAAWSTGNVCVTMTASFSFLRPGRGRKLRAEGSCTKAGGRVIFCEAKVFDETGAILCTSELTMFRTETKISDIVCPTEDGQNPGSR